jgi:hypothetical protein
LIFNYASERKAIRIIGDNVLFIDLNTNQMSPFEGLKIRNRSEIIKEFPDLSGIEDKGELQTAVAKKFKEKIKALSTETKRAEFMIQELKMMGGTPLYSQRMGHRPKKLK